MPAALTTTVRDTQAFTASLAPLDWLLLAITAWSILRGFLHGAIRELFAIAASVTALVTAYWQYPLAAMWLGRWVRSAAERSALGFLLVAVAVFLAVALVGRVVRALAHKTGLGVLDRLAGAGLGVAQAALVGTILITALSAFLPTHAWVQNSRLAGYFAAPARVLAQVAPVELERRIISGIMDRASGGDTLR